MNNIIVGHWQTEKPKKYGKYFVHRKDGKMHYEVWNGTGWAYNNKTITHWTILCPPCYPTKAKAPPSHLLLVCCNSLVLD